MNKTKLIVLAGFAGAGKTTIARRLAAEFNYPIFSPDEFNDGLRPLLNKDFHETSPVAYGLLWFLLKRNLRNNVTSILDMNMCADRSWQSVDEIKIELSGIEIISMILECSLDVYKKRIEHRGATNEEHLNLGGDTLDDVMYKYEFIKNFKRPGLVRIDANGSVEKVYKKVLETIT